LLLIKIEIKLITTELIVVKENIFTRKKKKIKINIVDVISKYLKVIYFYFKRL